MKKKYMEEACIILSEVSKMKNAKDRCIRNLNVELDDTIYLFVGKDGYIELRKELKKAALEWFTRRIDALERELKALGVED